MTIDPGTMNDRVTLQRAAIVDNPETAWPEEGFTDLATVWAKFRPTGGREFREGSMAVGEERGTFTLLYRDDLSQVDRIIFNGRIWDIASVAPVGWREALDLLCTTTGRAP